MNLLAPLAALLLAGGLIPFILLSRSKDQIVLPISSITSSAGQGTLGHMLLPLVSGAALGAIALYTAGHALLGLIAFLLACLLVFLHNTPLNIQKDNTLHLTLAFSCFACLSTLVFFMPASWILKILYIGFTLTYISLIAQGNGWRAGGYQRATLGAGIISLIHGFTVLS